MNTLGLRRLSELRSLLEGFAARHAAQQVADASGELDRLRSLLSRLTRAILARDYASFREADFELHETIVSMAQVPTLQACWRETWNALLTFHEHTFEDYYPGARVLIDQHEHLVASISLGDPAAAEDAARSHVEAIWFRVSEGSGDGPGGDGNPLMRATAYLACHLQAPLKLTEVARDIAFTSAGNLSRLFRQHHGLSFQGYLQRLRMEKAAELLRRTRLPIARIAKRVGYRDVSRFSQHFKRLHNRTPSDWRKG
jgi:AraC-like DNA-binding protein